MDAKEKIKKANRRKIKNKMILTEKE